MSLEDIPNMQVARVAPWMDRLAEPEELKCYDGKFIVIRKPGSPGENFVYAQSPVSKHKYAFDGFTERAKSEYGCGPDTIGSFRSPVGGGKLYIDKSTIMFIGFSTEFGRYKVEDIEDAAREWRDQNLPNHELAFE